MHYAPGIWSMYGVGYLDLDLLPVYTWLTMCRAVEQRDREREADRGSF